MQFLFVIIVFFKDALFLVGSLLCLFLCLRVALKDALVLTLSHFIENVCSMAYFAS